MHQTFTVLDWTLVALLSADVVFNFRNAYISSRGELVRDSKLIASKYMRGMFVPDVLAAIPFSLFVTGSGRRYAVWVELIKLIRLRQLVKMLRSNGQHSNAVAMLRLMIYLSLSAHWASCFWHYLSEAVPRLYSAFLLLLGDRPDANNNVERIIVTCLLFMGTLLYAVVMGSMAVLVANMWAIASRHKQRAQQVRDALRYRGVCKGVQDKVGEYFDFLTKFSHPGSEGVSFLQELPVGLHGTVMASMFGPFLAQVQLFTHCEQPFVWRLAQKLRLSLFMTTDVIYELGSVGHDMYIIWKGAVGLVAPDGCMAAVLGDGDHFGELGLMTANTPRPHRAVALRPCDVVMLSRWDLQEAMKDFPDSAALVKERARLRVEDHEAPTNVWAFAMVTWGMQLDDDGAVQGSHIELHNGSQLQSPPPLQHLHAYLSLHNDPPGSGGQVAQPQGPLLRDGFDIQGPGQKAWRCRNTRADIRLVAA
ncbi:hypothetical protein GPECTOR_3g92 [Gonium pectorale]|uniref:Cyclic nucleotide-binding domain-containing protein n=1 Tax=Gonium pectorale TaxID=33097 RepID=A0A150H0C2_GONPE|nr:hypothetical protein GPECTOR_3g92 [Gonium pectorale]|eukprot:KXZ55443.1 hypothetical protein GPECTOR_3g92 [Gonium pectorale]